MGKMTIQLLLGELDEIALPVIILAKVRIIKPNIAKE
jgi:hypothetical protein